MGTVPTFLVTPTLSRMIMVRGFRKVQEHKVAVVTGASR